MTADVAPARSLVPPSVWSALARAAGIPRWPPADASEALRVVEQAAREGLLPLLFEADPATPDMAGALQTSAAWRLVFRRRAGALAHTVSRLAEVLDGEPFVLLKGADYAWRLYPRPDLRPMQDLDILVRQARIEAVSRCLLRAGAVQRFVRTAAMRSRDHYERVFTWHAVTIEVHRSFAQPSRHRVDYEAVWERRAPLAVAGTAAFRLSDVDGLAYHALSMAKDEFCCRLVRYVDLWLMVRGREDILAAGLARAREWEAVRAYYAAVREAMVVLEGLRGTVADALLARALGSPTRAFLDRWVLPDPRRPWGEANRSRTLQLWRKFWLLDGSARRLAFAAAHARGVLAGALLPHKSV
jgi:hypothetical protein